MKSNMWKSGLKFTFTVSVLLLGFTAFADGTLGEQDASGCVECEQAKQSPNRVPTGVDYSSSESSENSSGKKSKPKAESTEIRE